MKQKKFLKLDGTQGFETFEKEETTEKTRQGGVFFLTQASEIGFQVAIPICLGALGGVWLDKKFGTQPLFMLSLLLVGILFAFLALYNIVRMFGKKGK